MKKCFSNYKYATIKELNNLGTSDFARLHSKFTFSPFSSISFIPFSFISFIHTNDYIIKITAVNHLLKKSFREIVVIPRPLHLICNPLSEVRSVGLLSLYFRATDRIRLSGDRRLKSTGNS